MTKTCLKCKNILEEEDFYKSTVYCKRCERLRHRLFYEKHKLKKNKQTTAYSHTQAGRIAQARYREKMRSLGKFIVKPYKPELLKTPYKPLIV